MTLTEQAIRDRLFLVINELNVTMNQVAEVCKTHDSYLSLLKKTKSPKISAVILARFCEGYGVSPHYLLLGKGPMFSKPPKTKEEKLIDHNEKLLTIIGDMLNELLVFKAVWTDKTKEIASKALKSKQ